MTTQDEAPLLSPHDEPEITPNTYQNLPSYQSSSAGITLCSLLLTLFNIVLAIMGFIACIVGISAHIKMGEFMKLVGEDNANKGSLVMIVTGAVCVCIAVISHLGAKHQSKWIIRFSTFFLFCVFITVMVAASTAVAYHGKIEQVFRAGMENSIKTANWDKTPTAIAPYTANAEMEVMSQLQKELKCCGLDDFKDWDVLSPHKFKHSVPVSCCIDEVCGKVENGVVEIDEDDGDTKFIYTKGCFAEVNDFVSSNVVAVLLGCYGLAVFQLVGMVFSICLHRAITAVSDYTYSAI